MRITRRMWISPAGKSVIVTAALPEKTSPDYTVNPHVKLYLNDIFTVTNFYCCVRPGKLYYAVGW